MAELQVYSLATKEWDNDAFCYFYFLFGIVALNPAHQCSKVEQRAEFQNKSSERLTFKIKFHLTVTSRSSGGNHGENILTQKGLCLLVVNDPSPRISQKTPSRPSRLHLRVTKHPHGNPRLV